MLNAARRGEGPSTDALDLDALFAGLEAVPALCLAVSGGPDSMALLHLAACWRDRRSHGPALHVATVDHALRQESREEALLVASIAGGYGLPHAILRWEGEKPATRIQERARDARYRLLDAHARDVGAAHVLTAHHADDQAETVLMRLGRGSGVTGLAAMHRDTPGDGGIVRVRPLLDLAKADLRAICQQARLPFVTDPSNANDAFHRVRLRRQAELAASLGLTPAALRRLARRMARADEALEAEVDRLLMELLPRTELPGASRVWRVALGPAKDAAPEIVQRMIGRAVKHVAGARRLPLEKLETLADGLRAGLVAGRSFHATLAGARLALTGDGTLTVMPEAPRLRPN